MLRYIVSKFTKTDAKIPIVTGIGFVPKMVIKVLNYIQGPIYNGFHRPTYCVQYIMVFIYLHIGSNT